MSTCSPTSASSSTRGSSPSSPGRSPSTGSRTSRRSRGSGVAPGASATSSSNPPAARAPSCSARCRAPNSCATRSSARSRRAAGRGVRRTPSGVQSHAGMVNPSDFRNGMTIEWEGGLWVVLEFQQGQNARGDTFFRTKLRNVRSGAIIDQKFRDKDRFARARIEKVAMQYLYSDGDRHYFMDLASYDQLPLSDDQLGDTMKYLKENSSLDVLMYEGRPLGVELPTTVDLKVTQTSPGFKGDTAAGGGKPATVETGLILNVPFFVNQGDVIRVDTRTGAYVERV